MSQRQHYIHKGKTAEGQQVMTAFLPSGNAMVTMATSSPASTPATPEATYKADFSAAYQPWGPANNDPTQARLKIEASTTAFPIIAKRVKMMFGKGVTYWKETVENGVIKQDFTRVPEIDEFLSENDIDTFHLERMMDLGFINNAFCEFIFNQKGKIGFVNHLEAEFSRFGEIEKDTFKIKNIRYESDWAAPTNKVSIPYIPTRLRQGDKAGKELIDSISGQKKFAMHHHFPSPGRTLYATPAHNAIFVKDGWLDYANSIPILMNKINQNANTMRFHVEIPGDYWERTNANWKNLTEKEQKQIIDDVLSEMDDWFKGKGNDTFISHFAVDHAGKYLAGWRINVLNVTIEKGKYVTELNEADLQLTRSLDMDSSLSSMTNSNNTMGAGSGSDKRTAYTNTLSMSHADMHIVTAPLRVVQMYNGWDPAIKFGFLHDIPTTLNQNPSGITQNAQP